LCQNTLAGALQVILDHLYREGLFEVGDALSREVHMEGSQAKDIFSEMHRLLKEARARPLDPMPHRRTCCGARLAACLVVSVLR
jgi:hypothetical protein